MTLKSDSKFKEKLTFGFGKFSPEHSKVSKLGLWWDTFIQSRTWVWRILTQVLKILKYLHFNGFLLTKEYAVLGTKELSFMTLNSDAKFQEKLTGGLENDIRNFANFHQSTRMSQNWDSDGVLLSNVENVWA